MNHYSDSWHGMFLSIFVFPITSDFSYSRRDVVWWARCLCGRVYSFKYPKRVQGSFTFYFYMAICLILGCYYHLKVTVILCLSFCQKNSSSNNSIRREPASRDSSGLGKKDAGKFAKKPGMSLWFFVFAIYFVSILFLKLVNIVSFWWLTQKWKGVFFFFFFLFYIYLKLLLWLLIFIFFKIIN